MVPLSCSLTQMVAQMWCWGIAIAIVWGTKLNVLSGENITESYEWGIQPMNCALWLYKYTGLSICIICSGLAAVLIPYFCFSFPPLQSSRPDHACSHQPLDLSCPFLLFLFFLAWATQESESQFHLFMRLLFFVIWLMYNRRHDFQSFAEVPLDLDPYTLFGNSAYFSADFVSSYTGIAKTR